MAETLRHSEADASAKDAGLLLIISGPSGAGKTTISRQVKKQLDAAFSVSLTTRAQTSADTEGADYFFVSKEEFEQVRDGGGLLEWAEVFGNYYGTPRDPVEKHLAAGRLVLLEIDVQGAIQVKKQLPDCFAMFVTPPSEEELLSRLRSRQREDEAAILRRYAKANEELALARQIDVYDYFLINDDLDKAIAEAVKRVAAVWK
jgi:guanylate kinase